MSVAVSPAGGEGGYVGPWCEAWASFLGEGLDRARRCPPAFRSPNLRVKSAPIPRPITGGGEARPGVRRRNRWKHVVATWLGEGGGGVGSTSGALGCLVNSEPGILVRN